MKTILLIAFTVVFITGCNAQQENNITIKKDSSAVPQHGSHHFTLDGEKMYYNGIPFMLGDSIKNYAKLFGPHFRVCNRNYVWDSLGIVLMVGGGRGRELENERVAEIKWYLVRLQNDIEDRSDSCCTALYNSAAFYFSVPYKVIPEPLEFKNCDMYVSPMDKIGTVIKGCGWYKNNFFPQVYVSTNYETEEKCFYEDIRYAADMTIGYDDQSTVPLKTIEFISVTAGHIRNWTETVEGWKYTPPKVPDVKRKK